MPSDDTTVLKVEHPPEDALEFLEHMRSKLADQLETNSDETRKLNCDIEQNIRAVRALLSTNSEILARCMIMPRALERTQQLLVLDSNRSRRVMKVLSLKLSPNQSALNKHSTPHPSLSFPLASKAPSWSNTKMSPTHSLSTMSIYFTRR